MTTKEPAAPYRGKYLPASYRKPNVFTERVPSGTTRNVDSYWDGGSRDNYELHRNGTVTVPTNGNCGIGVYVDRPLVLEKGDVLVRTGVFCGKTSTATITFVD